VTARKIEAALLGSTWVALGVAFAGAMSTPRNYCYDEGADTPTSLILVYVGLPLAILLQFAAIVAATVDESRLRERLVRLALSGVALAAGIGIVWLTQHQTSSWGCG